MYVYVLRYENSGSSKRLELFKNLIVIIFVGNQDRNYNVLTFISKCFRLKNALSDQFCGHHQNCSHVYQNNL